MIDIRAARSDPETWRGALERKGAGDAFDELMAADRAWLELVPRVDELRGRTKLKGKPTPEQIEELKSVKAELGRLEQQLADAAARRDELLVLVPNPPDPSAPDGAEEEDAVELRRVGEQPSFEFEPRDHLELGWIDMERAARVSGSRFAYRMGDFALAEIALYRFALDRVVQRGFVPVIPPVLVREEAMYGTGFLPTEEVNIYSIERDGLYLTGTSEVALASLHLGEILEEEALPLQLRRLLDLLSPRGRSGRQGHPRDVPGAPVRQGRDVRLLPPGAVGRGARAPAHDRGGARRGARDSLPGRQRRRRRPRGASATKKYDIEAWFPSQGRYREITSTSNTTDFQARRLDVRYRSERGVQPVHTLNGTAVTARALLAVMENFQQEDGSVAVPESLQRHGAPARIEREPGRRLL